MLVVLFFAGLNRDPVAANNYAWIFVCCKRRISQGVRWLCVFSSHYFTWFLYANTGL